MAEPGSDVTDPSQSLVGKAVWDKRLSRSGVVTEVLGALINIRPVPPVDGYRPWIASPHTLRYVTRDELIIMGLDGAGAAQRAREAGGEAGRHVEELEHAVTIHVKACPLCKHWRLCEDGTALRIRLRRARRLALADEPPATP